MSKIAIVGCGWLGLPLAKKLIKLKQVVIGTTTSADRISELKSEGVNGRIFSIMANVELPNWLITTDLVIIAIPPSKIDTYCDKIALFCKKLTKNQKVIYVSSSSVYADNNSEVTEASGLNGTNRSGPEIIKTEKQLREILGERLTVVRMSGLVGGNRQPGKYFAGKTKLSGASSPVNMIHQEDAVGIILKVVTSNAYGKVYNACSTEHPTRQAYYSFVCEQLGLDIPMYSDETQAYKIVNNDASKSELGYKYIHDNPMQFPLV